MIYNTLWNNNKGKKNKKMDNLIFSLNATVPVFALILVGYVLKRIGITNKNFVSVSNKINYNLTLPVLLFMDISAVNVREKFDIRLILFCMIVTSICFFTIWGLTRLFVKDKGIIGAFVQASYRGSAAVLGIAFVQNMYGSSKVAPLMVMACVPLYNMFAVIVLTVESKSKDINKDIKSTIINILKNPMIISIVIGIIASYFGIRFPKMIDKSLSNIAVLATPMALISIGSAFEGKKAIARIKPSIVASFIKLILQAVIFVPIAIKLGFRNEELIAILIMLAAPTTASCYIMADNTDNDTVLTASIVVLTTLLSAITLTLEIFILKYVGLV